MKPQHTPGPWKLLEPDQVRGPNGEWVCDCQGGKHRTQQDRANAVLIHATLDLLQACRMASAINCYGDMTNEIVKSAALKAIAKAEGHQ